MDNFLLSNFIFSIWQYLKNLQVFILVVDLPKGKALYNIWFLNHNLNQRGLENVSCYECFHVLWMFSRVMNVFTRYECFHVFQMKMTLLEEQMWFIILYISVIKTRKFRWCIVMSLWFNKRELKSVNWSL